MQATKDCPKDGEKCPFVIKGRLNINSPDFLLQI